MRKLRNDELKRLSIEEFKSTEKTFLTIVLDNVRSMHNIGSIFRSSDAFLVEKIYLCGITAVPPHNEIHKTALGATNTVAWEYYERTLEAIDKLKSKNYLIAAVEQTEKSIPLQNFEPVARKHYAVVFGHEVRGVQQEVVDRCDFTIEIPQYGTKHSLNISVCAGIVIWEFFKKLKSVSHVLKQKTV